MRKSGNLPSAIKHFTTNFAVLALLVSGCAQQSGTSNSQNTPQNVAPESNSPNPLPPHSNQSVESLILTDGSLLQIDHSQNVARLSPQKIVATVSLPLRSFELSLMPRASSLTASCERVRDQIENEHQRGLSVAWKDLDLDFPYLKKMAGSVVLNLNLKVQMTEALSLLNQRGLNFPLYLEKQTLAVDSWPQISLRHIGYGLLFSDVDFLEKISEHLSLKPVSFELSVGALCDLVSRETQFHITDPQAATFQIVGPRSKPFLSRN